MRTIRSELSTLPFIGSIRKTRAFTRSTFYKNLQSRLLQSRNRRRDEGNPLFMRIGLNRNSDDH